jgi:hypothetical protein
MTSKGTQFGISDQIPFSSLISNLFDLVFALHMMKATKHLNTHKMNHENASKLQQVSQIVAAIHDILKSPLQWFLLGVVDVTSCTEL